MATTTTTPLMNLVLPVVGPDGQLGPTWATNLNDAFNLVDAHTHTTGSGARITSAAININADLSFGSHNLLGLNTSKYDSLLAVLASSFTNSVYVVGGELYFNDGTGANVKMTSGGTINVSSLGAITGDYATSTADLNYSDTTKTFTFKQSATATAFISCGSVSIFENVASAKFTKIQNTTSQASDQTITLWAALPASTLPVSLSAAGVLSAAQTTTAQIADVAVTTAKIADSNVTTAKIADSNVTTAKIADNNITTAKILAANVTQAKLQARASGTSVAAGGYASSASSGAFTHNTSSFTDVTNLSVTIVSTGRPIRIECSPFSAGTAGYFGAVNGSGTSATGEIRILRDGSAISRNQISTAVTGSTAVTLRVPAASVFHVDEVAAGTYVYKVQVAVTGGDSVAANAVKLAAWEI